ncbi:MAG: translesion error-prone DNA polymerase V autoproteolytic subunit [Candidatus Cloacimonetes bacterium]|nr:translesion error-prone DNA polymerase V autoproteolytic subunit [Candidatus Cloacimonadota bacterium]
MKKFSLRTDQTIAGIFSFEPGARLYRPLIGTEIPAGFPSPAQDYIESSLDLNRYLITHPTATFFVKVQGLSMVNAGINPDDILIVDRSLEPSHNRIVIAVLDGELTVKRLRIKGERWFLVPENPEFSELEVTEEREFSIWGVVTYAIHKIR